MAVAYSPVSDSAGILTNPDTATVLADTGALPRGFYEIRVLPGCSVAAIFYVQHRNSGNDANVTDATIIRAAAGQTGEYILKFPIDENQRVRVLPAASITGNAEAFIQAIKIG